MGKKEKIFVICLAVLALTGISITSITNSRKSKIPNTVTVSDEDDSEVTTATQVDISDRKGTGYDEYTENDHERREIVYVDSQGNNLFPDNTGVATTETQTVTDASTETDNNIITESNISEIITTFVQAGQSGISDYLSPDFVYTDNVQKNRMGDLADVVGGSYAEGYISVESHFEDVDTLTIKYSFTCDTSNKLTSITADIVN